LEVNGRASNRTKNLACYGLLRQRFGELLVTILQLFERCFLTL